MNNTGTRKSFVWVKSLKSKTQIRKYDLSYASYLSETMLLSSLSDVRSLSVPCCQVPCKQLKTATSKPYPTWPQFRITWRHTSRFFHNVFLSHYYFFSMLLKSSSRPWIFQMQRSQQVGSCWIGVEKMTVGHQNQLKNGTCHLPL